MGRGSSKWYNLPTWLFLLSLGANSASIGWALKLASQLRDANVEINLLRSAASPSSSSSSLSQESKEQPQQPQAEDHHHQQQQQQQQQQQHANEIGKFQSLIEQMQREHQERLAVLENENHDLKDRCNELEYLFRQQKDHHDEVTQRHLADQKQLELLNLSLTEQLTAANVNIANIANTNAAAAAALESQLQQQEHNHRQQSELMIASLNEQLSSLRSQSAELNQELAITITKVEEHQKQLALVSTERDSFRDQLEHVSAENKLLVTKSLTAEETLRLELEQWKRTAATAEESERTLESNITQLESEKRDLSRVISRLEETIIQEHQVREQLLTEKQQAVVARQKSEHDMQESLNDKAALRDQIDKLSEKLQLLQVEHETLRTHSSLLSHPAPSCSHHHPEHHQTSVEPATTTTLIDETNHHPTADSTATAQPPVSLSENGPKSHPAESDEFSDENNSHHQHHQDSHHQTQHSKHPNNNQNPQRGGGNSARRNKRK